MIKQSNGTKKAASLVVLLSAARLCTAAESLDTSPRLSASKAQAQQKQPSMVQQPLGVDPELRLQLEMLRIWRSRSERDVAPELMRFLKHDSFMVRYQAAIFLGYLEYPLAEEPLHTLLEHPSEEDSRDLAKGSRRLRLRLALARIRTRGSKSQAKIEAMAASIGRSLDTLTPKKWAMILGRVAPDEIVQRELFELLYSTAKKGEDIEPLRSKLNLIEPYNFLLDGAALPFDAEVTRILDLLEEQKIGGDGYLSDSFLPNMGPRALDVLLKRLQDMLEHPEQHFKSLPSNPYHIQLAEREEKKAAERGEKRDLSYLKRPYYALGYSALFWAASLSDDPRFLPVLKQLEEKFQNDPDSGVRDNAKSAQEQLQTRLQLLQTPDEAITPPQ